MTQATTEHITALVADLHRDAMFRSEFLVGDLAVARMVVISRTVAGGIQPYNGVEFSNSQLDSLRITAGLLGKLFGIDLSISNPITTNSVQRGCPAAGCGCPCKRGLEVQYRSTVRISIPGQEAMAFAAVLARMLQLCVDTAVDPSVTSNILQSLASATEIFTSNPETTIDVGIYLTLGGSAELEAQKPYLALILSGLRGIASRTGESGYVAEMDSLLAAIMTP